MIFTQEQTTTNKKVVKFILLKGMRGEMRKLIITNFLLIYFKYQITFFSLYIVRSTVFVYHNPNVISRRVRNIKSYKYKLFFFILDE